MRILGHKILFVTAHPDDESYLAAGTILKNRKAGGTSYVACATFGEQGKSHLTTKLTKRELRSLRKKELVAVSKFLQVKKLFMPGLPDTRMGESSNQNVFFQKLLRFASQNEPSLIVSFGDDGISGHMDHISVGKVAKQIARKLRVPFITFTAPPDLRKSLDRLKRRRKHGTYVKQLKHRHHDFKIKIDGRMKLKALRLHKSQLEAENPFAELTEKTARQFLSYEYFSASPR